MASKQAREQIARHEAATLARIAMRMQRAPKDKMDKLLVDADACLSRYKMARFVGDDKVVGIIDDQVIKGLEVPMETLAEIITDAVAPRAYLLLVFESNDAGSAGARMAYVSNAHRGELCQAMREFIVAHEKSKP